MFDGSRRICCWIYCCTASVLSISSKGSSGQRLKSCYNVLVLKNNNSGVTAVQQENWSRTDRTTNRNLRTRSGTIKHYSFYYKLFYSKWAQFWLHYNTSNLLIIHLCFGSWPVSSHNSRTISHLHGCHTLCSISRHLASERGNVRWTYE